MQINIEILDLFRKRTNNMLQLSSEIEKLKVSVELLLKHGISNEEVESNTKISTDGIFKRNDIITKQISELCGNDDVLVDLYRQLSVSIKNEEYELSEKLKQDISVYK